MNVLTRLRRLERDRDLARTTVCSTCGAGRAEPEFSVTFDHIDLPDLCPECGRRQVFRIEFDRRG